VTNGADREKAKRGKSTSPELLREKEDWGAIKRGKEITPKNQSFLIPGQKRWENSRKKKGEGLYPQESGLKGKEKPGKNGWTTVSGGDGSSFQKRKKGKKEHSTLVER